MKFSSFNNRLSISENGDILYNAFSQQFCIIKKGLKLDLNSLSDKLKALFIKKGIIVPVDEDERLKSWNIFIDSATDDSSFKLTINPTLNCNFRCWYCYEQHHATSNMSADVLERVKKYIAVTLPKYKKFELAFFGGEPLLEFDRIVLPLTEFTHSEAQKHGTDYSITFTTNGFLITDKIISALSGYNIATSQITLDGGPTNHNKTRVSRNKDSFITIVENIRKMLKAHNPVALRMNLTKDNITEALAVPEYFANFANDEKQYLSVLLQQVWQDAPNDILDEMWELYEAFMKIGVKPWRRRFDFITNICYADKLHSAVINYNGDIFKCTAVDFDKITPDTKIDESGYFDGEEGFWRRIEKRRNNNRCNTCRILPMCNGGCCKNVDQSGSNISYCLYPTDENKDKVVLRAIREQLFMSNLGLSWY